MNQETPTTANHSDELEHVSALLLPELTLDPRTPFIEFNNGLQSWCVPYAAIQHFNLAQRAENTQKIRIQLSWGASVLLIGKKLETILDALRIQEASKVKVSPPGNLRANSCCIQAIIFDLPTDS
jgi:hypothetical protein